MKAVRTEQKQLPIEKFLLILYIQQLLATLKVRRKFMLIRKIKRLVV